MKNDKKLKGNESAKGNGFDNRKENINRKGRPRKSFSTVNDALKKNGVTPITKAELLEAYSLIFNATENEISNITKDKDVPVVLKYIIAELKNTKTRSRALIDYRDYLFGRSETTNTLKGDKESPIAIEDEAGRKKLIAELMEDLGDDLADYMKKHYPA